MAILGYDTYRAKGGELDEQAFAKIEPRMEVYLNGWTLNRLKSAEVVADLKDRDMWGEVETCAVWLTDRMQGIEDARAAKANGQEVTSFNNGVNSFSFGGSSDSTATAAEQSAYREICRMLPVELVSACVSYNDAR